MYQLENYIHWGQDVAPMQEGENSSAWQEMSSAVALWLPRSRWMSKYFSYPQSYFPQYINKDKSSVFSPIWRGKKKWILKVFFMKFLVSDSYSCAETLKALWTGMVSFE